MENPFLVMAMYVVAAAGTLALGLFTRWYDRKLTAMVQYRQGPPWYQPIADVLKLFYKETLMPATAKGTGFLLAPAVALATAALTAAILWAALVMPGTSFIGDLVVVIYLLLIPPIATIIGASASGTPQSAIGASREMKLILSYELPFILALLVGVIQAGGLSGGWSFNLGRIAESQQGAAGATLYSISGGLAMLVAIVATQAKLGQVPFDLAEAECEIMSGVYAEYSGLPLGLIYLGRSMLMATMPLLLILMFWGGLTVSVLGVAAFAGKYLLLVTLVTLIRNTNPRLRIDQAMNFFWRLLTPLAAAAVVLALLGRAWGKTWV
jgi:NADH-quinone oxidoreductase subunit H